MVRTDTKTQMKKQQPFDIVPDHDFDIYRSNKRSLHIWQTAFELRDEAVFVAACVWER